MTAPASFAAEMRGCHHNDAAVAALQESDKDLWLAAYHSAKQWGMFKRDGVASIARDSKRSVSQIQNYAHAFDLLVDFHKLTHVYQDWGNTGLNARRFMRVLTPSHFWKMWTLRSTYNVPTTKCLVWISNAAVHGWSGETMIENALIDLNKKKPPAKVATVRRGIASYATEILARLAEFTEREVAWARETVALFGSDGKS